MLEDRLQLGDAILGLSVVAFGLGYFDASLAVDPGTEDGGRHHGIFFSIHEIDNLPAVSPCEGYQTDAAGSTTSAYSGLPASTNEVATPLAMPVSESDDALARQMVFHRLTGSALVQSQGFPAGFGISSAVNTAPREGGMPYAPAELTEIGDSAGHSAQILAAAGAASTLSFNASTGQLAIRTDAGEHTVREGASASGFVDMTLDGQDHSSDPSSPSFDSALAGATSSTLAGIRFAGSGEDTLILGSQHLAGGLAVQASGATVLTENVATAAALVIQAPNVTVRGALQGSSIALAASGWVNVDATGRIDSAPAASGGRIDVAAGVFVNSGQLRADGPTGGQISVQAGNILNAGPITANATDPSANGGQVHIAFTGSYVATTAAVISTSNEAGPGGQLVIDGGNTGRLYSSGPHLATGSIGGTVNLFARDIVLSGATLDASGATGGGSVRIGGHANAQTVTITPASTIRADAVRTGNGGDVFVAADQSSAFDGIVSARGGPAGGSGGFVEVSGQGDLSYGGSADAGAPSGKSGTLLLDPKNITISDAPVGVFPQFDLIDPHPTAGGGFGSHLSALSNGNVVVTNPNDNFGGNKAGAVYLFDGLSGALISSLVGGHANDQVGYDGFNSLVIPLSNGNYLIQSPFWNGNRGAVTLGNGTIGVSGTLSSANSLVGSNSGDLVGFSNGSPEVTTLSNGNYAVLSTHWNGSRGAVTWGNGSTGVSGTISDANSLVGSKPSDGIGSVIPLTNGNYVVVNPSWNGQRGAVTWGNGSTGVSGTVSEANSLVGTNPGDQLGGGRDVGNNLIGGIATLSNGNYVVRSASWNGNRGAATWGNGTTGISGTVSAANSLVGSDPGDQVGESVTPLSNGNYLVDSPNWNNGRGAVTWENGSTAVRGTISIDNSLVGSNPGDKVGSSYIGGYGTVTALSNGNYLVQSPLWNGARGAVTWGNGSTGISGTISPANSLVGSNPGDLVPFSGSDRDNITLLSNGNYVVASVDWNDRRGAVTWANGTTGVTGAISDANSLVGSNPGDEVGGPYPGITPLTNGNYVVPSPNWNGRREAVTWGSGNTGISGAVSDANSLVGSHPGDGLVGPYVVELSNGNYVVASRNWNEGRGAVSWENGSTGVSGTISVDNSLVGSNPTDYVGYGVTALSNGNYVVLSSGAVTWENGSTGVGGIVSADNSLIGSSYSDVIPLTNGNYVVRSPSWNESRGAVTWGNGNTGTSGTISEANSLVGNNPDDQLGYSPTGSPSIIVLSNAAYAVNSPLWNGGYPNGRGAVTWIDSTTGQTLDDRGLITPQNSLLGRAAKAGLGDIVLDPVHQSFLAPFVTEGGGRVTVGLTDPNQFTYGRGQTQTVAFTPRFLTRTLNTGTAVALQASNDITVNSPITVSAGGKGGALTLQAGRSILLNASITTDNSALTLVANDQVTSGVVDAQRDPGNAVITMASGTSLNTGSGPLTVELRDGAGLTNRDSGAISLQTVTAGSVSVVNKGLRSGSDVQLGAVTTSRSQYYANANGTTLVTGNLTAADTSITFIDSLVLDDGVTVTAGADAVFLVGGSTQTLQGGSSTRFGNVNHLAVGTLQLTSGLTATGSLINAAGIFDANDQPVTVTAVAAVLSGRYLAGTGRQTFNAGLVITNGVFTSSTGPMTVTGGITVPGGLLSGVGTIDFVTANGGTVAPGGNNPGVLTVSGATTFTPSSTLSILLGGTKAGTGYSQLRAGGPIDLGSCTLSLVLGFQPPVGSSFEILANRGSLAINGKFTGLDEGAVFTQSGYQFQITYQGGTGGESVVLTRLA